MSEPATIQDPRLAAFEAEVNRVYDRNAIRVLMQACGQVASVSLPERPEIMATAMTNAMSGRYSHKRLNG